MKYLTLFAHFQVADYIHDVAQVLENLKRKPICNYQFFFERELEVKEVKVVLEMVTVI